MIIIKLLNRQRNVYSSHVELEEPRPTQSLSPKIQLSNSPFHVTLFVLAFVRLGRNWSIVIAKCKHEIMWWERVCVQSDYVLKFHFRCFAHTRHTHSRTYQISSTNNTVPRVPKGMSVYVIVLSLQKIKWQKQTVSFVEYRFIDSIWRQQRRARCAKIPFDDKTRKQFTR